MAGKNNSQANNSQANNSQANNSQISKPQADNSQTNHPSSLNQGWTYTEQVDRSGGGQTLLDYYSQRYRHSSPVQWQERIESGQVLVDQQLATAATVLQAGQTLTYHRSAWLEPAVPLKFEVLWEDADLLVIAKPAGLPVLPGGGFLEHTLLRQLQRVYREAPVPIHRLGRGTSGLMLLARSPLARSELSQQMRQRQIRKTYRALIPAAEIPDRLTITQPIGKVPHPILGSLYAATPTGHFAQSEVEVLQRRANSTLLQVTILTGRPHQIRIHLASVGYPLIGDPLYQRGGLPLLEPRVDSAFLKTTLETEAAVEAELAAETVSQAEIVPLPGDCGYHLHAYQIDFRHPRSDRALQVSCPAPDLLQIQP